MSKAQGLLGRDERTWVYYQASDSKYHMAVSPIWLLRSLSPGSILLLCRAILLFHKPFFLLINIQKALKSKNLRSFIMMSRYILVSPLHPNPASLSQYFFKTHLARKLTFTRLLTVRVNGYFLHFRYLKYVTWSCSLGIPWGLVRIADLQALPKDLSQNCISNNILRWSTCSLKCPLTPSQSLSTYPGIALEFQALR